MTKITCWCWATFYLITNRHTAQWHCNDCIAPFWAHRGLFLLITTNMIWFLLSLWHSCSSDDIIDCSGTNPSCWWPNSLLLVHLCYSFTCGLKLVCEECHLCACFVATGCWSWRSLRPEGRPGRAGCHWACKWCDRIIFGQFIIYFELFLLFYWKLQKISK